MDQPTADTMLRALDRFVGEWTMQATPPGGPPWSGEARVRFAWFDGGAFLVERWTVDLPEAPDGTGDHRLRRGQRNVLPALLRRAWGSVASTR